VRAPLCLLLRCSHRHSGTCHVWHVFCALCASGGAALNVQGVPIRLNGFEVTNLFASPQDVARRISCHYVGELLGQVYKVRGPCACGRVLSLCWCRCASLVQMLLLQVVLSSGVLGNPFGVISSLGGGVRDFFVNPLEGAVQSPSDFAVGVGAWAHLFPPPSLPTFSHCDCIRRRPLSHVAAANVLCCAVPCEACGPCVA
jgi:hypothetical protein